MSIRTPVTEQLGIPHPILLAPMDVVADARLTTAVSAAGGLVDQVARIVAQQMALQTRQPFTVDNRGLPPSSSVSTMNSPRP
jgi:NAD(P)H-dependent flavin oxidoreductase YrpB (nitropropane dioxygenase family)